MSMTATTYIVGGMTSSANRSRDKILWFSPLLYGIKNLLPVPGLAGSAYRVLIYL